MYDDQHGQESAAEELKPRKRSYAPPRLATHGTIQTLTEQKVEGTADAQGLGS
jgi:hypothetical protein